MITFVINSSVYKASRKTACLSNLFREMIDMEDEENPEIVFDIQNMEFVSFLPSVFEFFNEMEENPLEFTKDRLFTTQLDHHCTTLKSNYEVYFKLVDLPLSKLSILTQLCDYLDIPLFIQLCLFKIATMLKTYDQSGKLIDKSEEDVLELLGNSYFPKLTTEQVVKQNPFLIS